MIALCVFAIGGCAAFSAAAQQGGASGGDTAQAGRTGVATGHKDAKTSKAHKGGRKSKKGSSTTWTTPPPK
jgi:hypothetical protein